MLAVLWLGLFLLPGCDREETTHPEAAPGGPHLALHLPPGEAWNAQVSRSLQDTLHLWLYHLGAEAGEAYRMRPHPDDGRSQPRATASAHGEEEVVLDVTAPLGESWWRVFVRKGLLAGQSTFALQADDHERAVALHLAAETPSLDRLVVYEGLPTAPGTSPPMLPPEDGEGAAETILFPVAVENAEPIDGLELTCLLGSATQCEIYADAGSRLFAGGDSGAYRFDVTSLPTVGPDCQIYRLRLLPTSEETPPIAAGSDVLFYVAAGPDVATTDLCVNTRSVRFLRGTGAQLLPPEHVINLGPCAFPPCALTLTSPESGDLLCEGETATIVWSAGSCCGTAVAIRLLHDGEACAVITDSTSQEGAYAWTVAACAGPGSGYQIHIEDLASGATAVSAGSFVIAAGCTLAVSAPGDGAVLRVGEEVVIAWEATSCCGEEVAIELLQDGAPCLTITEATANDGELLWSAAQCDEAQDGYGVRIVDLGTGAVGESEGTFQILPLCELTVASPSGGERLCEGDDVQITWTGSGGCGSHVRIELLHDGSACLVLADSVVADGTFDWVAQPCGQTTSGYRVRITDLASGAEAISDETFTIDPACTLAITAPQDGDRFCEGEGVAIAWSSSQCCGDTVRLELLHNGEPCAVLGDTTAGAGAYTWTADPCVQEQEGYSIRVTDRDTGVSATSSGSFAIDGCEPPAVTSPSGSDVVCAGDEIEITWTAGACCGEAVAIDLLCDGEVCASIAEATENDGSHRWNAVEPPVQGAETNIRVADLSWGVAGESDAFTITPGCELAVLQPSFEDLVCEGAAYEILWTYSACCQSQVQIELLQNGDVCQTLAAQAANSGSFAWDVARCQDFSAGYAVRISEVGGAAQAVSPLPFGIAEPCTMSVLAPSPQQTVCDASLFTITWDYGACCGDSVGIELLHDGEPCVTITTGAPNDGEHDWSVAACGTYAGTYSLEITDLTTGFVAASGAFLISSPCDLTVTYPDSGETVCEDEATQITWTRSSCCGPAVRIELLREGDTCLTITESASNTGAYTWVPSRCGGEIHGYRVRVTDIATQAFDESDLVFPVEPACVLAVTAPTQGDVFCEGDEIEVAWTPSSCCSEIFSIDLMCDGELCQPITTQATGGAYTWIATAPTTPADTYQLRVSDSEGVTADLSGSFTIVEDCSLTVTYPNGGQELCEGDAVTITWDYSTCCGPNVDLTLLREGQTAAVIATGAANDGSYTWTAQREGGVSVGYQIRVSGSGASDESDAMFSIRPPCDLTLLTPQGGSYFYEGDPVQITWDAVGCCGNSVSIQLLLDGAVCLTISSSTPNDGTFNWIAETCSVVADYSIRITDLSSQATATIGPITIQPFRR